MAKGGGAKKRFHYCVNPNSSNQFLYLRSIQGHSGNNAVDPALQDNVLFPKGFTEYIYHVGNASAVISVIRNGLIPGGRSLKRGIQAVFFTTVNPMEDGYGSGETPWDLTKPRILPDKNTWKRSQNNIFWCNLELAQERGLQFYQARSRATVLFNTLPAACIEKAVCVKTSDELYLKVRLTPRVRTSCVKNRTRNMVCKIHKTKNARSSWEPSSDSNSYGEPCNNTVDHRIAGVPQQSSSKIQHARTKSRG